MNKLILAILCSLATQSALAIECTSEGWEEATPILTFSADPIFKSGQLVALNNLSIYYVGPQVEGEDQKNTNLKIKTLWLDSKYKPHKNKSSARFNLDEVSRMEWSNGTYGGIIHALILPTPEKNFSGKFNAILTASDDVYHDGIYTYFKVICE